MAEKHPHKHPQSCLIVYYKTENGEKRPWWTNRAYIIAFYRGEIYTALDDPLIKNFYDLKQTFENNRQGNGARLAMIMVCRELDAQGCWYTFPVIRTSAEVNYLLNSFFKKCRLLPSCKHVWDDLKMIGKEIEKAEEEIRVKLSISRLKKEVSDNE